MGREKKPHAFLNYSENIQKFTSYQLNGRNSSLRFGAYAGTMAAIIGMNVERPIGVSPTQLASYLEANAALGEEKATLWNMTTNPHPGNPIEPHSPARSKSTYKFSPPRRQDHLPIDNPRPIRSPSHRRSLDPTLRA